MNVLVVGAGRMGQRHLRGLAALEGSVHVVDQRPEVEAEVRAIHPNASFHRTLEEAPLEEVDAAILAETAAGRAGRIRQLLAGGVRELLVEKPLEQSRAAMRDVARSVRESGARARCNLSLRLLPFVDEMREAEGPLELVVTGGAFGLGCNGIHWIDLARHLAGGQGGELLFGEIEDIPIGSGRGPRFRDYGGRGVFGFPGGSRLFVSSSARSSAPMSAVVTKRSRHLLLDLQTQGGIAYARSPGSTRPPYAYGADYGRAEDPDCARLELWEVTREWALSLAGGPESRLPELAEAAPAHELLFDLLETSGGHEFPIT